MFENLTDFEFLEDKKIDIEFTSPYGSQSFTLVIKIKEPTEDK